MADDAKTWGVYSGEGGKDEIRETGKIDSNISKLMSLCVNKKSLKVLRRKK